MRKLALWFVAFRDFSCFDAAVVVLVFAVIWTWDLAFFFYPPFLVQKSVGLGVFSFVQEERESGGSADF
jgi:hypothetical protein